MNIMNLSLTDELQAFIEQNCGDGTLYESPSEFVRDLLRQRMLQLESERVRSGIIDGYRDAIAGRTVDYHGDLRSLLEEADS